MKNRCKGFTLFEVIVALGLASVVLVGLIGLVTQMSRTSMASRRRQDAQVSLAFLLTLIDREMRQATYLPRPSSGSGQTLEGCSNAAIFPGDGTASAIDAAQPMRWFAFCSAGSAVNYHMGAGCPASYTCGSGSAMVFGGADGPAGATFTRNSPATSQLDVSLTMTTKDQTSTAQTAVAFAAAAGSTQ